MYSEQTGNNTLTEALFIQIPYFPNLFRIQLGFIVPAFCKRLVIKIIKMIVMDISIYMEDFLTVRARFSE